MPERDWTRARELLRTEDCALALVKDDDVRLMQGHGVRPLLTMVDEGEDLIGFSAADKVVGQAAAWLYITLGVTRVHGELMSEGAKTLLEDNNIACSGTTFVPVILNRTRDDWCPMEKSVKDAQDAKEATEAMRQTRARMMGQKRA